MVQIDSAFNKQIIAAYTSVDVYIYIIPTHHILASKPGTRVGAPTWAGAFKIATNQRLSKSHALKQGRIHGQSVVAAGGQGQFAGGLGQA